MSSWSKLRQKWLPQENRKNTRVEVRLFPLLAPPVELQLEVVLRIYDEPWEIVIGEPIDGPSVRLYETNTTAPLYVPGMRNLASEAIAKKNLGTIQVPRFPSEYFWQSIQTSALRKPFIIAASTIVFRGGVPLPRDVARFERTFPHIKRIRLGFDMSLKSMLRLQYEYAMLARTPRKETANFAVEQLILRLRL